MYYYYVCVCTTRSVIEHSSAANSHDDNYSALIVINITSTLKTLKDVETILDSLP